MNITVSVWATSDLQKTKPEMLLFCLDPDLDIGYHRKSIRINNSSPWVKTGAPQPLSQLSFRPLQNFKLQKQTFHSVLLSTWWIYSENTPVFFFKYFSWYMYTEYILIFFRDVKKLFCFHRLLCSQWYQISPVLDQYYTAAFWM